MMTHETTSNQPTLYMQKNHMHVSFVALGSPVYVQQLP